MQSHDLRRLVTTFLVLALLAGSATLAVTSLARQRSEGPSAIAKNAAKQNSASQIPKIGEEALIEQIPGNVVEGYDLAKEFSPTITTKDNFTDTLAKGLAYEFVSNNPNGPEVGYGITPPNNINEVMDAYITDAALVPTTYAIDETKLKVAKNYTAEQVGDYLATLDATLTKLSGDRGVGGLVARTAITEVDEAAVQASNFVFSDAQDTLYNATVPEPAAELHRSVLTYLELNRKLSDLDYATDPLKAVVFATKFPELRAKEETRMQLAAVELEKNAPQMLSDAREPFMIASILGVRSAHALVFTDLKHIIVSIFNGIGITGSWSQTLIEYARKIATQVLKNQIVGRMIQQTIQWVQGGGKPQFITNWKKFLTDAATNAADLALTQIAPQLCSNFSTFTTGFSRATTQTLNQQPVITCTLNQVVQNIRQFYDDFRTGGWEGFIALTLPQNNVWGAVILSNEAIARSSAEAANNANQEASANQGFKGMQRCVSYDLSVVPESSISQMQQSGSFVGLGPRGCFAQNNSVPDLQTFCLNNPTSPSCAGANIDDLPGGGNVSARYCEIKVCRPDGMQTTTPGGTVAGQLEKALGGSLDNIVNAEDLAGLVGVLIDAAITKLIGTAEKGILGLFEGGGSGTGTGTGTGTGATSTIGGGTEADIAGLRSQAIQLVASLESRVSQASSSAASWPSTASSTVPLLRSVAMTCTSYASDANQRIGAIDRIAPTNAADLASLGELGDDLATLRAAITNSTSAIEISDLMTQIDGLSSSMASVVTRIAVRVAQIEGLREAAQENLNDRACNISLPTLDE